MNPERKTSRRPFLTTLLAALAAVAILVRLLPAMAQPIAQPTEKPMAQPRPINGGASGVALDTARQAVPDTLLPLGAADVRLEGWLGAKLDLCLRNRVMAQNVEPLVKPFREQTEVGDGDWRGEYWGKWFTSAALGYAYRPTPQHRAVLDKALRELLATQNADGYIGTHRKEHRLKGWDVWGRKYVLLGLIAHYDLSRDKSVLDAARRHLDSLLQEVGPGRANIAETGFAGWKGLPPTSILEPAVLLYQRTGDPKYLAFARSIVAAWSQPNRLSPNGMRLIEQALAGTPVARFEAPKAYEMTSCFEGLAELYRTTGEPKYLEACKKVGDSIIASELFIVGSGSSREVWFGGEAQQAAPKPDPMETCVTATWMKYCHQLLRLTGEPRYADQMEISLYNALLGAMKPDGGWWGYYMPLAGTKRASHIQHGDVGLSCCVTNGPRALLLTPQWAVMTDKAGPVVNLYNRGVTTTRLASGRRVRLEQQTDYPLGDAIHLSVEPDTPAQFTLKLRIPAWSQKTVLTVNGKPLGSAVRPGSYAAIARRWQRGDRVLLKLDMRGRILRDPGGSDAVAVMRGPVVLAWDRRLQPEAGAKLTLQPDTAPPGAAHANAARFLQLTPVPRAAQPGQAAIWMAFNAPCVTESGKAASLTLCDYASAGNTWDGASKFGVWMPQPLDFAALRTFEGAQWVWFAGDAGDLTREAPTATRYFRRAFTLPANMEIKSARLLITADDAFTLHVNGEQVGRGDKWLNPQRFDLATRLKPGRNVLAVEASNTNPSPAGLIARLEVKLATGETMLLTTDDGWKSVARAPANWQGPDFDDYSWQTVKTLGAFGCQPWGAVE